MPVARGVAHSGYEKALDLYSCIDLALCASLRGSGRLVGSGWTPYLDKEDLLGGDSPGPRVLEDRTKPGRVEKDESKDDGVRYEGLRVIAAGSTRRLQLSLEKIPQWGLRIV